MDPGPETVTALDSADPAAMPGAELVDAIVTCERAISHLQATQAALTAAFARPGVAGDLTGLTENLTRRSGAARGPGGAIDPDVLAAHQQDYARSLASAEIAAALHIPHRTAAGRVTSAVELVDQLPATWAALHRGDIDQRRATLIADGTRCLPSDLRGAAENVIVPLARTRISSHVKELLERAVIAADPEAAARREQDARSHRHVRHRPGENGTGDINAHLRAEDAVTIYTLLDLLAQATSGVPGEDGEPRDIDARRADALTDIATELLATGRIDLTTFGPHRAAEGAAADRDADDEHSATPGAARSGAESAVDTDTDTDTDATDTDTDTDTVSGATKTGGTATTATRGDGDSTSVTDTTRVTDTPVTDAATSAQRGRRSDASEANARTSEPAWRGLSRHGRRPHLTVTVGMSTLAGLDRLPGHLAGHGAITAELATTIAQAYQTLALVGIDGDTGTARAVSATVYRPRQALADRISTLATHCRFPSCRQPGWRADHDHRVPFNHQDPESGGLTSLWDCDPECRRHHVLKTHAQWVAEGRPDRTIDWTSPTGHHYRTRPTEYRLPGEDADLDIGDLILPATWPPPKPEPPEPVAARGDTLGGAGDTTAGNAVTDNRPAVYPPMGVAPPSAEMRRYLEQMRRHDQHLAQLRAVAARARRILAGYRAGTPACAGCTDCPGCAGTGNPCHTGVRAGTDTDTGVGSTGRSGHTGNPGRTDTPACTGTAGTTGSTGSPARPDDHFAARHRPRTHRDYLDTLAVDRAMRRATGQPDPNDEPPPF